MAGRVYEGDLTEGAGWRGDAEEHINGEGDVEGVWNRLARGRGRVHGQPLGGQGQRFGKLTAKCG